MEVYWNLGRGFLEAVYQDAIEIELQERGVPYTREAELTVSYKNRVLKSTYRADFLCYDRIVVETKALDALGGGEQAQLLNYLKVTGFGVGLLLNFGGPKLEFKRMVIGENLSA